MFKASKTGVEVVKNNHEATYQNLRALLLSEKGEFEFDPFFGIRLKRYAFDQDNYMLRDILQDEIYTQIKAFMPQISIRRDDISLQSSRGIVYINIKCTNRADFKNDMYNIVLFQEEE